MDNMIDSNNQRRDTFLANAPGAESVINNALTSEILHDGHTAQSLPGPSKPLDDCVSANLFEISQSADSLLHLSHERISLRKLLSSTASYQAKQENVSGLGSLLCCRHVKCANKLTGSTHCSVSYMLT